MKPSLIKKLEATRARFDEVNTLLALPETVKDHIQMRKLGQERNQLQELVNYFNSFCENQEELEEIKKMQDESDAEMKAMAQEEILKLKKVTDDIEDNIKRLLTPVDPYDSSNIFLEIRAGTGGDEAAIFAGDLFRMYSRYALIKKWKVEILSASEGEHGGYKEIITRVVGKNAYSYLKFESGAHRVQRVPETESQGRIHTSAATVAVLPEVDEIAEITIDPSDLRIDTFRASGAGGQHVNKTDSAIRITHLPTGIAVECQEDRSQHRNKARALALLKARLLDQERQRQNNEQAATRKSLIGSGDRSTRIRTYNFPQGRVTDHRIELTLYQLPKLMEGEVDMVIGPLTGELQAELMAGIEKDE